MGLTPFACITEQDYVRVVYPDGHIETRSRSCSVYELLRGNPDYFVCGSTPYTITNRMASHEQLERGFTYFVGAAPNAQPFMESHSKRTHRGASRMLPRFSRHGVQGREMRSPTHQSRRVFDVHSAKMQLEGMKTASGVGVQQRAHHHLVLDRPPRHLKLVFFRHCLQALRLPRHYADLTEPSPLSSSDDDSMPSPSSAMEDVEIVNSLLKSAARSELGIYVSRRQEFYLRRQRRRRKPTWKPVLQSISETSPVVDFRMPEPQQSPESAMSKRFSPPQPAPPRPTKNISPPRQPASSAPPKCISPPRQQPCGAPQKYISPPRQTPQRRKSSNQRSLYMA